MTLDELLTRYKRIAVVGGPVTGKSIITDNVSDRKVFHSDDLPGLLWSERSQELMDLAKEHEAFVVAGIAADRAVKKGLDVDCVVHCTQVHADMYKPGQKTLKKQIDKRARELALKLDVPLIPFEGRKASGLYEDALEAPDGN